MLNDLARLSLACLYVSKLSIWESREKSRDSRARDKGHECPSQPRRSLPRVSRGSLCSPSRPLAGLCYIQKYQLKGKDNLKVTDGKASQYEIWKESVHVFFINFTQVYPDPMISPVSNYCTARTMFPS